MKIRTDYVSNSSSCSFVVKDAKGFVDAFSKDVGNTNDWSFWFLEDHVNVQVACKERDAPELEMALREKKYTFREYEDWDYDRKWKRTLDDVHWTRVTLGQLFDCPEELLGKIDELEFEGEDGYLDKNIMSIFYKYCEACGLNPSAGETETAFDDTLALRMIKRIAKNGGIGP